MIEEWKDIPEYEGFYQASTLGRVRSRKKILTPNLGSSGSYFYYHLYKNGNRNCFLAQRLMLATFDRLPNLNEEGRHKDGNWRNNNILNLEWGTHAENEADKQLHGTAPKGSNNAMALLTEAQVIEIKTLLLGYKRGDYVALAKRYSVSRTTIEDIAHGRTWKHINIESSPSEKEI